MISIPTKTFPAYSELVAIEGITYKIRFTWNTRGEYWTISIYDQADTAILTGIKVVLDYELIADFVATDIPGGLLYAINASETLGRVGRNDLGILAKLIYVTEAERASI